MGSNFKFNFFYFKRHEMWRILIFWWAARGHDEKENKETITNHEMTNRLIAQTVNANGRKNHLEI